MSPPLLKESTILERLRQAKAANGIDGWMEAMTALLDRVGGWDRRLTKDGGTPLHVLMRFSEEATDSGMLETALLASSRLIPEDDNGWNPLHTLMFNGTNLRKTLPILRKYAAINDIPDAKANTPLHVLACRSFMSWRHREDRKGIAKELISNGEADPTSRNVFGRFSFGLTPADCAVAFGNYDVFLEIVDMSPDINGNEYEKHYFNALDYSSVFTPSFALPSLVKGLVRNGEGTTDKIEELIEKLPKQNKASFLASAHVIHFKPKDSENAESSAQARDFLVSCAGFGSTSSEDILESMGPDWMKNEKVEQIEAKVLAMAYSGRTHAPKVDRAGI